MKIKNMKQVQEHMKDMNMKRLFRRNQIIITTLAVMIAAAGYLNYAGKKDLASGNRVYEAGAMDISDEDILAENQAASLNGQAGLQEIPSLDQDPSDLDAVSDADGAQAAADTGADQGQLAQAGDGTGVEEATQAADPGQMAAADTDSSAQAGLENPGEAVLTSGMNVADYKGFSDPVVSMTKDKVDVVINAPSITDPQRAQIEDIVKRKAEVGADQIIITLLNMAE